MDETVVPPNPPAAAPETPNTPPAPVTPPAPAKFDLAAALDHPQVKAEIAKQAAAAATRAAQEAQTKAADEAKKAADRAKMEEVDRMKAEKADAEEAARKASDLANAAAFDRDLYATLLQGGQQLASAEALDYLKYQAQQLVAKGTVGTVAEAISATLAKHSYLVKAPTIAPPVETPPPAPTRPTVGAPPPKDTTGAGNTPPDNKEIDVLNMSAKEYQKYKRDVLGIQ